MPRSKHPEETVQKILDVSLKLFMEKGFEQTTILDIVNNLGGLTRGAFYHHFKSKEEVITALSERISDSQFTEKIKNIEGQNGLEKIKNALKYSMDRNYEDEMVGTWNKMAIPLITLSNPRFIAEQLKGNQEVAALLEPLIKEGMADGSIQPGNAGLLAELFTLLANFWLISPSVFPLTRADFFEKGMVIKQLMDKLGFPVLDDEVMEKSKKIAKLVWAVPGSEAPS